jgi:hypothetical protein
MLHVKTPRLRAPLAAAVTGIERVVARHYGFRLTDAHTTRERIVSGGAAGQRDAPTATHPRSSD